MRKTPERFLWAIHKLNIKPGEIVLEIGCGTGLLAELICQRLSTGHLQAVDKSPSMVEKAKNLNHKFVESGKALFIVSEFRSASLPTDHFDKVVAFNVNIFFKEAIPELESIKKVLKKNGQVYLFYQPPFNANLDYVDPIIQGLVKNSFEIIDVIIHPICTISALCIMASPTVIVICK